MSESSHTFNFDDFAQQVDDALEENEAQMAKIRPLRRPGEIGGVLVRLSQSDIPDDAA